LQVWAVEVTAEDCKEHFPTRSFTAAWGQPMAVEQGDWSVVVFQIAVAVLSTNRMYRTRDDWGNVHEFSCFICVCYVCAFYFIECTSSWIIFSLSRPLSLSPRLAMPYPEAKEVYRIEKEAFAQTYKRAAAPKL
jgi:hypothetical protein